MKILDLTGTYKPMFMIADSKLYMLTKEGPIRVDGMYMTMDGNALIFVEYSRKGNKLFSVPDKELINEILLFFAEQYERFKSCNIVLKNIESSDFLGNVEGSFKGNSSFDDYPLFMQFRQLFVQSALDLAAGLVQLNPDTIEDFEIRIKVKKDNEGKIISVKKHLGVDSWT